MNVIVRANKERFKEATNMCEALREIWAEDFEQARSEGVEIGIKAMIESSKECGGSWDKVFQLVKDKFNVDSETAEKCMKLYW